jgi:TonB family protein
LFSARPFFLSFIDTVSADENTPQIRQFTPTLFTLVTAMNRKAGVLLLALFFSHIGPAHADSVKDALNHKFKKQVLALRSPWTHGDQKFDSAGQPVNGRPKGPWLFYGGILVQKLDLSSDALRLEGPRVVFSANKKKGKPVPIALGKAVRVEIHLDQPLKSLDEAQVVLDRVFFSEGDTLEHARPEFRRSDDSTADEEIYRVNKDDTLPPRATYTPEPEFSEAARQARFQGTVVLNVVVDKTGNVTRIRLERALGYGLDENAMEGVKTWRFQPATRNGQPVAVEMNIEYSFNLY